MLNSHILTCEILTIWQFTVYQLFIDNLQTVNDLISNSWALNVRDRISDDFTSPDPDFYRIDRTSGFVEDSGTTHISVLAQNGDAVSVTSTLNQGFGSGDYLNNFRLESVFPKLWKFFKHCKHFRSVHTRSQVVGSLQSDLWKIKTFL